MNRQDKNVETASFATHLQDALTDSCLTISKHAKSRLDDRNIEISSTEWKEISERVSEAKKMGVNESLVLVNDAALIVSAKNQTVITAMNRKEAASQIFTNINGTIIMD
ncbi:TIGR02530 family flagellar biosynthesis protein [Perspicuibacillus lycopersici]